MTRVLFVDDEPAVLNGLRRLLRGFRREWDMSFAESGSDALELMAQAPFDVIVTDLQMPGMGGGELLRKVMELYPSTVRIVLSGTGDRKLILDAATVAHQLLGKPAAPDLLRQTISRCCALEKRLGSESLRSLVNSTISLPSLPTVYTDVVNELRSPEASVGAVSELIEKDVAMTTKLLQFVNSSFFGLSRQIDTPLQAAGLLGLDLVKSLVLSAGVFAQYEDGKLPGFSLDSVMNHCLAVGSLANKIGKEYSLSKDVLADALLAGTLHDVGLLVLADSAPEEFSRAVQLSSQEGTSLAYAEQAVFGTTHAFVSGYLLQLWNFTSSVVEAASFHLTPSELYTPEKDALFLLHVANVVAPEQCLEQPKFDDAYLQRLDVDTDIARWEELAGAVAS